MIFALIAQAQEIFGKVETPAPVLAFGGGTAGGGLVIFASNMIKVITVLAGIFGLFNVISAGITYLGSSGNPKAADEAGQKLLYSFIGLAIIVFSFTITAVISLLFFGDAGFILNPTLPKPPGTQ